MLKTTSFKLVKFATLLMSCAYVGSALSTNTVAVVNLGKAVKPAMVKLTNEQLLLEQKVIAEKIVALRKAEDDRLNLEQQQGSEQRLTDIIGTQPLMFKSAVAKIYTQNDYILLWEDKKAEKQFLREYAALVASGISRQSAQNLDRIYNAEGKDRLVYDILLTDAFLDYLYYSQNVLKSAQKWLYSPTAYKSAEPTEQDIYRWLSAVKNNQHFEFVAQLAGKNSLYRQTLYQLEALISSGKIDPNQRYKLAINTQRLRILPEFYNGIFVNVPSYQLNYYRNGRLVMNSRVIVGKQARKTPVMYSKLSNVVVNPPWIPTTRLIDEDLVPKIKRDPGYVARNGYTITDGSGRIIDPHSINWEAMGNKFPYRIRQAPGDSALGNYKFNMPSADAIYLHDTPNHNLFNKKDRALSSGCIRVEQSDQLASILLKEVGWSDERKRNVLGSKKTTSANVGSENPVYLYYVTAWMNGGKLHTLPDIYGYDAVPNLNYVNWNAVKKYLM
ncbi:L,D-transpeptidase family protein [Avibacterium sp. 21-599]|uniref:L,D-transpeptidase family protein n=1 Tax=Avibacterium sp. 21-599 TaxID=2911528 RepID=UPI002247D63F|nr:L,D-transpeptidase family protein [Avibacterium sp. 21-599]MCW9718110.1 L,D-transpeptidase family protein [Avibacterium sp. 21-599]